MKKSLIGAIVGGIIIFIWQFLSWALADLHRPANEYTPKQDSIMAYLNSQFSEDGQYMLPNLPKTATSEDHEKLMKEAEGKSWAQISYHKSLSTNMTNNMARGLVVDIVMVWLACWLLGKISNASFFTILMASLAIGLIAFIHAPYTNYIWFKARDINAHLIDAIASWGLTGLWLGWWLRRK